MKQLSTDVDGGRLTAERVAAGIEPATHEARARVEETLSRLRNSGK